jgi:hypothetical protein
MIQRRLIMNQIRMFRTTTMSRCRLQLPIGSEQLLIPYKNELKIIASTLNDIMYNRGAMHHGPNSVIFIMRKNYLLTSIDFILLRAYLLNNSITHHTWPLIRSFSNELKHQITSGWPEKNDPLNNIN